MASAWYPEGLRALMNKEVDLDTDTIKVRAIADDDYTYSSTDTTLTPIVKYTSSTDATVTCDITTTPGTLDGTDLTPAFSALAQDGVKSIDALVIFQFITDDAGSTPLIYIDLTTPIDPNTGDINITWNASGIASL